MTAPHPADAPHRTTPFFELTHRLTDENGGSSLGRAGVIHTDRGDILTPAFIPVGTKATVKTVLPESMAHLGAQALLANAYHLYLQPGVDVIDAAGGLGAFMNWSGPTFTDSGGFQVMSLGAGFKKVLLMNAEGSTQVHNARHTERLAHVDDDGVTFKSHIDGSKHRFTPEIAIGIEHAIGADIIFAFDECTTLAHDRKYQEISLDRTHRWARRCVAEHERLQALHSHRPHQFLMGVVQGAHYPDLRRKAATELADMGFDGYGIGGALEKSMMGEIISWTTEILPQHQPRHLLGIADPDDIFVAVENGCDTFDCVTPSRNARNGAVFSHDGRFNITNAAHKRAFEPIEADCTCYTCRHYTRAYVHHLFKAKEMLAFTLATIHNEHFIVNLVARMRQSIIDGNYWEFRKEFIGRYYATKKSPLLPHG